MGASPHQAYREGASRLVWSHLLLEALSVTLVRKHLFLLECFLCKTDLNFNDRTLVNYSSPWLALIDKKLMASNLDCLSLLQVAHQSAKEMRLQNLTLDQLNRLICSSVRRVECFLSRPYWRDADDSNALRHTRIHLDFCAIWNCAKERSAVFDKELVILNLKYLALEQARTDTVWEVWLENTLKQIVLAHLYPTQRNQIDTLDALSLGNTGG